VTPGFKKCKLMTEIKGQVVKRLYAVGSKSEREAVFLVTKKERYLLRQMGGNPYYDEELEKLVGKTIKAKGEIDDYIMLLSDWKVVDD
jgi:hypothetical protein